MEERAAREGADRREGWRGHRGPAVVLLDLHMPVMDGWRFVHEYARWPEPRGAVVAFTASRLLGPVAGTATTIRKPFTLEELVEVVGRLAGAAGPR